MSEIKPRSMRMSDENYSRLQSLSEGRSMDDTITFLLTTHDKDEARNGLGPQAIRLDELDEYLDAIRSQFAALLHSCRDAKELVRSEVQAEIREKNQVIEQLKDDVLKLQKDAMRKNAAAQEAIESLRDKAEKEQAAAALLQTQVDEGVRQATSQQQIIDSLSTALSSAEKKADQLEQALQQLEDARQRILDLEHVNQELRDEKTASAQKLETVTAQLEQITLTQEDHERQFTEQQDMAIRQLTEAYDEKLERAETGYQESLSRLKAAHEQQLQAEKTAAELRLREVQLQAREEIHSAKEAYQEKLFTLMMKDGQ